MNPRDREIARKKAAERLADPDGKLTVAEKQQKANDRAAAAKGPVEPPTPTPPKPVDGPAPYAGPVAPLKLPATDPKVYSTKTPFEQNPRYNPSEPYDKAFKPPYRDDEN